MCREKFVQVRDCRPRICDLFKTLFLLERNQVTLGKNLEHDTNLDNYSNRFFFKFFEQEPSTHPNGLFNGSAWKS